MLTNTLVRSGRPFELVVGLIDDPATVASVADALRVAAAATRLRRARIGRVGPVFQGYDCVDADDDRLRAATGIEAVRIEAAELRELYLAVDPARVAELERETRELYAVDPSAEGDVLARSLRAACALDDLVERHRLDAGAINCHVPEIRFGEEIGIAPCFALGRQTSRGIPWACAGDVVTAVAMLTLKALGGAAQYHELESLDYETGELVVASSGEHDLAFAGERPRLASNLWYDADPHCGACACFAAPAGPATLVGVHRARRAPLPATASSSRPGEFTGTRWPAVGTPYAAFRFGSGRRSRPGRAGAARAPTTTRRRRRATSPARSRASRGSSASTRCASSAASHNVSPGTRASRRRTTGRCAAGFFFCFVRRRPRRDRSRAPAPGSRPTSKNHTRAASAASSHPVSGERYERPH